MCHEGLPDRGAAGLIPADDFAFLERTHPPAGIIHVAFQGATIDGSAPIFGTLGNRDHDEAIRTSA